MNKFIRLVTIIPLFTLLGCNNEPSVDLSGYAPEIQTAIKDFVKEYSNKENAYVVTDFDNTTVIYDIAVQCSIYQLETMSFAMDEIELHDALSTSLELDDTMNNYIDDATSAYQELLDEYESFSPSGVKEAELEALHANTYWKEFATKMKCLYTYVEDNVDDILACEWIMYWYTGMTEQDVYNMFKRSCEKYQYVDTYDVTWTSPSDIDSKMGVTSCSFILGCSVATSVKNMLKYYHDNNIDIWVCSASHVDGVRGAVDAYGLSDYITGVIGMTQKMSEGEFIPEYEYETGYPYINKGNGSWEKVNTPIKARPSREGKVTSIKNALVSRYNAYPLAGFMDSSGDFNFCTEFAEMKMVICYNRADRKITDGGGLVAIAAMYQKSHELDLKSANKNGDTLYLLQGRDENGKRDLRNSNYTLKYQESSEKLYANEDNFTLHGYLSLHQLSLENYFNTFVIKTPSEQSVIGVKYGYLSSYAGYHSS